MNSLIVVTLLSCMFATGYAISCGTCVESTSDNPNFQPPADPNAPTCDNPTSTLCEDGINSCMAVIITMELTFNANPVTVITKQRQCGFPAGAGPAGDVCLSEEMINAFSQGFPNPADLFAGVPELEYLSHETSICSCDSSDNCTPPANDAAAAGTQPEPEPTQPKAGDGAAIVGGTMETTTAAASSLVASTFLVLGSLLQAFFCWVMQ